MAPPEQVEPVNSSNVTVPVAVAMFVPEANVILSVNEPPTSIVVALGVVLIAVEVPMTVTGRLQRLVAGKLFASPL